MSNLPKYQIKTNPQSIIEHHQSACATVVFIAIVSVPFVIIANIVFRRRTPPLKRQDEALMC
ncbi:hypothetical protein TIFTF001_033059 [Ficus carica]|uniref:Uncharacterized protein n=1 Tax=Ficus carica TaxID=3494 RepID=A0AA88DY76_FICCA|nr:hypothetical protein TIFTF001_033059 [Ficus carica]